MNVEEMVNFVVENKVMYEEERNGLVKVFAEKDDVQIVLAWAPSRAILTEYFEDQNFYSFATNYASYGGWPCIALAANVDIDEMENSFYKFLDAAAGAILGLAEDAKVKAVTKAVLENRSWG